MGLGTLIVELVIGGISFVALVATYIFFGSIIKHQFKIFFLARRGYTQIRKIREDMVERYWFLRIKDSHWDFDGGVYIDQPETHTKTQGILNNIPKGLDKGAFSGKIVEASEAEIIELKDFLKHIKAEQIMDIKTLSWGIPTITYFGDNPNPVNYRDILKKYDAKNIAAMIKRIVMTKVWKLVRIVLILASIAIVISVFSNLFWVNVASTNAHNLAACQASLNYTVHEYSSIVNATLPVVHVNSTVVI